MSKQYPWEYHPHLSEDRLVAIAKLIRRGRHDAVDSHNPRIGGNSWTRGCCAFQFGHFRILQAVVEQRYAWLSIIDDSMRLIFRIGAVPVRFYSGDAEDPTSKTCKVAEPEHNQLRLAFPDEKTSDAPMIYRFAVEQDIDGSVLAIKFVGVRDQQAVLCWEVPLPTASIVPLTPVAIADEGVELGAPKVGLPGDDEEVAKPAS